jgi:hypothetical protein
MSSRVTVSLSTTPKRVNNIFYTLRSLFSQTRPPDEVIINIPIYCFRLSTGFGALPLFLYNMEKAGHIKINMTKDCGPATKFVPTVQSIEKDENHFLIWLDDDILYTDTLIEELTNWCPQRGAISPTGFKMLPNHHKMILRHLEEVDVVEGWGGVCMRTSDLPNLENIWSPRPYTTMNFKEKCFWHSDDYVMSRTLQANGIKTVVCNTDKLNRFMSKPLKYGLGNDSLQNNEITSGHHNAYAVLEKERSFDILMNELKETRE